MSTLQKWHSFLWWLAAPTIVLAGRLLFEETFFTWRRGPQLVGFALGHGSVLVVIVCFASVALAHVWLLVSVPLMVSKSRRFITTNADWTRLGVLGGATAVLYVPYTTWILLMVLTLGPGAHGGDFFVWGASSGEERLTSALIGRGVNVNSRNSSGQMALHGACAMRQGRMVDWLMAHGADVNGRERVLSETPLMTAAAMGDAGIVGTLLLKGADPNAVDTNGESALAIAKRYGQGEVVALLERVTKGTDVGVQ